MESIEFISDNQELNKRYKDWIKWDQVSHYNISLLLINFTICTNFKILER